MAREAIINSGVSEKLIAGAILTGGGSMMKGMLDLADSILQTPVRQGIPLGFKGQAQELSHPAYSCAIGLALLEAERWKQRNAQSKFAPRTLIDRAMQLFD
jgi:cell division protein FtsA